MADHGWVLDEAGQRWELRGPDWDTVCGVITVEFARRGGPAMTTRTCRRNGWPPLRRRPWIHCVLAGGPFDGLHEWLDPDVRHRPDGSLGPPDVLCRQAGDSVVITSEGGQVFAGLLPSAAYRRRVQPCGHGLACGFPYDYDARG